MRIEDLLAGLDASTRRPVDPVGFALPAMPGMGMGGGGAIPGHQAPVMPGSKRAMRQQLEEAKILLDLEAQKERLRGTRAGSDYAEMYRDEYGQGRPARLLHLDEIARKIGLEADAVAAGTVRDDAYGAARTEGILADTARRDARHDAEIEDYLAGGPARRAQESETTRRLAAQADQTESQTLQAVLDATLGREATREEMQQKRDYAAARTDTEHARGADIRAGTGINIRESHIKQKGWLDEQDRDKELHGAEIATGEALAKQAAARARLADYEADHYQSMMPWEIAEQKAKAENEAAAGGAAGPGLKVWKEVSAEIDSAYENAVELARQAAELGIGTADEIWDPFTKQALDPATIERRKLALKSATTTVLAEAYRAGRQISIAEAIQLAIDMLAAGG